MSDSLDSPASYDRGTTDANNFLSQLAPDTRAHEAGSDPFLSGTAHNSDFAKGIRLTTGKIVTSLPYVNWYLVRLDDARSDKPAFKITSDTGAHPIGVRESSPLPPNSIVLVFEPANSPYCGIIGVLPQMMTDPNLVNGDWISQGSNTGFRKEKYYWELLQTLLKEGGIQDFSDNRPNDSTACAEWGRFSELGLGVYLDSFMTFMRVDEETGMYAFYHDQMCRLSGHNLELRSSFHEDVYKDDQGEAHHFYGDTPYFWEALGAYKYGEKFVKEIDDHEVLFNPVRAKFEPEEDTQQAFYRYREWGGYLGQGRMREVQIPAKESGLHKYDDDDAGLGVFREQIALNGHVCWQTAKGFDLLKRCLIPMAKQKKLPDDLEEGEADDDTNYRFSGLEELGDGDEHKVKDILAEGEMANFKSAVGMLDRHAVVCNWLGLHPFAYHQKDFYLPEQEDIEKFSSLQRPLDYSGLRSKGWMDRPEAKKVTVDHRLKDVEYYENTAGLSITDDGAVVLFDGYGSEIRLCGGNIQISCPGSLFLQPGRSLIGLGGDDIIFRAQQSLDFSAGKKDMRFFARNNMQFLSHDGGMLFETRSKGNTQQYDGKIGEDVKSSGIVFKSPHAPVMTWSAGLYLRTGSAEGEIDPGDIILDSDKGKGTIRTLSDRFERYTENGQFMDFFGIDAVRAANVFEETAATLSGGLRVEDKLVVQGIGIFGNHVLVAGGHIITEEAANMTFPLVGPLEGTGLSQVLDALQLASLSEQSYTETGNTLYNTHTQEYYETDKPGNATVQKQAAFSFRNEKQYGTDDFSLPETRWQQLARGTGDGTAWDEEPVEYQSTQLMPYPGYEAWRKPGFMTLDPQIHKPETGLDEARGTGGPYADPKYGEWAKKTFEEGYLTNTE